MRDLILLLSLITIPIFVSGQNQFIEVLPSFINNKGLDYAKEEIMLAKTKFDIHGIYNLSQNSIGVNDTLVGSIETESTGKFKVEKLFTRAFHLNGKTKNFMFVLIDPNIPFEVFYELNMNYDGEIENEFLSYKGKRIYYYEENEKAYVRYIEN